MPAPPPRKVKPTAWLKEVHTKQLGSLQYREQQLLEIIEDVRSYSRQRADIERLYGQSLLKLSSQFLAKKELFQIVETADGNDNEHRTIHSAWKCCLEETEKLGQSRTKAADIYNQKVSERCKVLKAHKSAAIRKALEMLASLQADLSQSVKEFGVEHKQYTDDEIVAYEARNKANAAGQKLTNKETGVFSSVNTLKKSQAKTYAKMEQANARSTSSRNGYLLQLAAVNAHTSRMYSKHFPSLFKALDDGVYDELSDCISMIGQSEIDLCTSVIPTHQNIVSTCGQVTPQFNLDTFLLANRVFSEQILFSFEPVQNDTVTGLSTSYDEDQRLERETRNWARKVAKETRSLADLHDKINEMTNTGATGVNGMEVELAKLQAWVRRSEIAKLKAEARLDLLRTVNMPVDDILTQATSEHEAQTLPDNQSFTSRGSTHSADTFDSFGDQHSESPFHRPSNIPPSHRQEDSLSCSQVSALSTAIAIFDYKSNESDELDLVEGEILTILDHGTGDGWLRARNSSGQTGMVPENYIEAYEEVLSPTDTVTVENVQGNGPEVESEASQHIATNSSSLGYVRAIYDYQADGADELSFSAGQVITLLSRDENGIDDGYWKGEVNGVCGMFPSLVVEEMENPWSEYSEDATGYHQAEMWPSSSPLSEQQQLTEATEVQPAVSAAAADTSRSSDSHSFAGSYHQSSQNIPSESNSVRTRYRPAPAAPIDQQDSLATTDVELYHSNQPSQIETHETSVADRPTPVVAARASSTSADHSMGIAGEADGRDVYRPPKPKVDYSSKPAIARPQSLGIVAVRSSAHRAADDSNQDNKQPKPARRAPPLPPVQPNGSSDLSTALELVSSRCPSPKPHLYGETSGYTQPWDYAGPRDSAQPRDYGQSQVYEQSSDYGQSPGFGQSSGYAESQGYAESSRYGQSSGYGQTTDHTHSTGYMQSLGNKTGADVDSFRFRQMQPIPHQYYMAQSQGRHDATHFTSPPAQTGGELSLYKGRSSSTHSFTSLSSSDSREDKHLPIRMPGRRPVSENVAGSSAIGRMSVQDAARLMPQGLVNPSYRVATMSVDAMPSTGGERGGGHVPSRPTAARRKGGLPGHVRDGIVQDVAVTDDSQSVVNNGDVETPPSPAVPKWVPPGPPSLPIDGDSPGDLELA